MNILSKAARRASGAIIMLAGTAMASTKDDEELGGIVAGVLLVIFGLAGIGAYVAHRNEIAEENEQNECMGHNQQAPEERILDVFSENKEVTPQFANLVFNVSADIQTMIDHQQNPVPAALSNPIVVIGNPPALPERGRKNGIV